MAASLLAVVLFVNSTLQPAGFQHIPNYVAVLTDETGAARLTALTEKDERTMWLQWENVSVDDGRSVQLWAISRRDGQSRPLAVFDGETEQTLKLDQAAWRLVTDAAHLILTEEEEGGSAIDEPSDIILAKGICVQIKQGNAS